MNDIMEKYGLALAAILHNVYITRDTYYRGYYAWVDEDHGNRQIAFEKTVLEAYVAASVALGLKPVALVPEGMVLVPAAHVAAMRTWAQELVDIYPDAYSGSIGKAILNVLGVVAALSQGTATSNADEALSLLDHWKQAMDNPSGPPLEIHHADIQVLRKAVMDGTPLSTEQAEPEHRFVRPQHERHPIEIEITEREHRVPRYSGEEKTTPAPGLVLPSIESAGPATATFLIGWPELPRGYVCPDCQGIAYRDIQQSCPCGNLKANGRTITFANLSKLPRTFSLQCVWNNPPSAPSHQEEAKE